MEMDLALIIMDVSLIVVLLLLLYVLVKDRVVDYSVVKYLTTEEKLYLEECRRIIHSASRIIYWPGGGTGEIPSHIRRMEESQKRVTYLRHVAVKRLIQRFIFS